MRIALIVEGRTETAFKPYLQAFLQTRLQGRMPSLDYLPQHGRIPKGDKLKLIVENLLNTSSRTPADAVIALTDVYTGSNPPEFADAAHAKRLMRQWAGEDDRFFAHAAQYDFEAWLLPYWDKIRRLAGSNRTVPNKHPEQVNHTHPPARLLSVVFRTGSHRQEYKKAIHAGRILRGEDLLVSAHACPELKSLLNTILTLCGGEELP